MEIPTMTDNNHIDLNQPSRNQHGGIHQPGRINQSGGINQLGGIDQSGSVNRPLRVNQPVRFLHSMRILAVAFIIGAAVFCNAKNLRRQCAPSAKLCANRQPPLPVQKYHHCKCNRFFTSQRRITCIGLSKWQVLHSRISKLSPPPSPCHSRFPELARAAAMRPLINSQGFARQAVSHNNFARNGQHFCQTRQCHVAGRIIVHCG